MPRWSHGKAVTEEPSETHTHKHRAHTMNDLGRRSRIEVVEVEGPAFLAPALINDDTSGHTDEDDALLDAFCSTLGGLHVVSTKDDEEPYFDTIYIAGQRFAGDLVTYICHRLY